LSIFTFDIEEWYHLLDVDCLKERKVYESRIEENVDRLLQILKDTNTKATFFILGSIAKENKDLIRKIAERYDIGTHGFNHRTIDTLNEKEFKEDLSLSIKTIEDIIGKKITKYRAPGFSVCKESYFKVIADCGIEMDCSASSINHSYGKKILNESKSCIIECNGRRLKELPPTTISLLNKKIGFFGGGYFRLFPYWLIKKRSKELQNDYLLSYIHPRDLDFGQPMIKELPLNRKFKSYVGLRGAEKKLRQWLTDFSFTDIATAEKDINWDNVPIIKL
jgi:polysaccharide deacetylase family protein (PEP-CTERM system associated)